MNKLDKWSKLTTQEKLMYNGFDGFCKNELFKETTLFNRKKIKSTEFR